MLSIGLTGGIGSGKTTVANSFKELGVPIIDADDIAHEITKPNTPELKTIIDHFGKVIINKDGTLNRKKLREIIFSNLQQRLWLEKMLHPAIIRIMKERASQLTSPYCILVIPLLIETKNVGLVDRILVVDAPETLQIERTQKRSQLDEQQIRAILQTQTSRNQRLALADDVIVNDKDIAVLQRKVFELHCKYLKITSAG